MAESTSAPPSHLTEERARTAPDDGLDEAPPPYVDITGDRPPPFTRTPATRPAQPSTSTGPSPSINRQFPPTFNVYLSSNIISQRKFTLGEHKDHPFYAVTTHTGFSGNKDVVLHTGTSSSSAPLATAQFKTFSADIILTLPPLGSGAPADVRMKSGPWPTRSWFFAVEVATDTNLRKEPFAWRHSSGEGAKSIAGWCRGWKLVRTGSRDGNEVVAVFAAPPLSVTKKLAFQFVGAGETGEFGERWAVMAVISALGIWEKEKREGL